MHKCIKAESGASLIHSKVMALQQMFALQKLETIVPALVPPSLQSVKDFSAQHDQTELIKHKQ